MHQICVRLCCIRFFYRQLPEIIFKLTYLYAVGTYRLWNKLVYILTYFLRATVVDFNCNTIYYFHSN